MFSHTIVMVGSNSTELNRLTKFLQIIAELIGFINAVISTISEYGNTVANGIALEVVLPNQRLFGIEGYLIVDPKIFGCLVDEDSSTDIFF